MFSKIFFLIDFGYSLMVVLKKWLYKYKKMIISYYNDFKKQIKQTKNISII